jgi:hypothetical protein
LLFRAPEYRTYPKVLLSQGDYPERPCCCASQPAHERLSAPVSFFILCFCITVACITFFLFPSLSSAIVCSFVSGFLFLLNDYVQMAGAAGVVQEPGLVPGFPVISFL